MPLFRPVTQTVVAEQWNGVNEDEIRELLENRPFPPLGWWVVVHNGGVSVFSPADFASNYQPLL
jgi:hypothetical protein